ncbi:GTP cyclohydrolase 1 type 2/Nif3 [Lipomyces oligophaga]|uniref:GTP cyclohydrolase 1 type 2/Nif3 n=1 Tax=Lipomyces oligophaga TaxID=45792 RepID=UPI0034CE60B3
MTSTTVVRNLVSAVQRLFPKALADSAWDNTGLLLDVPPLLQSISKARVLLTIDLTTAVADEAISSNAVLIVSYHPIIFRPLKALSVTNSQQRTLIRLAQAGISVYCPHTAVDAQNGGMNDWLVKVALGTSFDNSSAVQSKVIEPSPASTDIPNTGFGRLVSLPSEPNEIFLPQIVDNVKSGLNLDHVQVAVAVKHRSEPVRKIALCAGSGSSVLAKAPDADLWFTGELSHHEILALLERNVSAIICGHTNTERGYLKSTFAPMLASEILRSPADFSEVDVEVIVSTQDTDPLTLF